MVSKAAALNPISFEDAVAGLKGAAGIAGDVHGLLTGNPMKLIDIIEKTGKAGKALQREWKEFSANKAKYDAEKKAGTLFTLVREVHLRCPLSVRF
eukprot:CAMPEP_0170469820 /NCGR_PEP_ID=MMETSP0123-20130129/12515_1 /TAXON_ID=182087 /ORGANISM="Favella ehrenbergii, Strain Fehren 1" /LENGTH=95 /DNA_ID=CAMNT_0010736801 /DNA_START=167 /DNA_END=454 /DNA_ORIENTATION=+